jgi:hypothetical protein
MKNEIKDELWRAFQLWTVTAFYCLLFLACLQITCHHERSFLP